MNRLINFISSKGTFAFFAIATAIAISIIPEIAFAETAKNWADVAKSGSKTLDAFKQLIVIGAYLCGTGLFVGGLWLIYKDGKEENRGHMKNGVTALIIGSLLLIFPTAVGWTTGSLGADTPKDLTIEGKF
jgi:hypothetical protein